MLMSYARLECALDLGLVRLGGAGLGNHLFPWGRSAVATHKYRLRALSPTWFQIKRRPLLQLEKDLRHYGGLFRNPPEHCTGIQRLRALLTLPRFREGELYEGKLDRDQRGIVVFEGMEGWFKPILQSHAFLRGELLRMARPEHLAGLGEDFSGSITLHVKRGDFEIPPDDFTLRRGKRSQRIPLRWFMNVVRRLRGHMGPETPVHVFSDGTEEELAELSALPFCSLRTFGSALADLLALSNANVLVASGSTFSMWAAFIGRMPAIYHIGQRHDHLYFDMPELEIEYDPDERLPDTFVQASWGEPDPRSRSTRLLVQH